MRQEHRPGEKLFVDWAGDKISVYEPDSRAVLQASLFVAVLGASNYTCAEATEDETMSNWIRAHVGAFEFNGWRGRISDSRQHQNRRE
jgi:transposase